MAARRHVALTGAFERHPDVLGGARELAVVPELRLVTCGGTFDRSTGHYRDNVVIEAVAVDAAGWTIG